MLLLALIAVAAALPVRADDDDSGRRLHRFLQEQQKQQQGRQAQRGAGADRRVDFRDNGRLTPDERRQLRRDVREAGDDIYRRHHRGNGK
jgi:hypothetical protein